MRILELHYNYMNSRQQQLLKAVEFVRKTFADRRINLDYSTESIQHLDKLFDQEFRKGKLKNPEGGFAKFQGLIMIGISGYLAQVIIKNAPSSILHINEEDTNWFINFKITGEYNRAIQPGQRILKRIQYGNSASLYGYVLSAINYFTDSKSEMPDDVMDPPAQKLKKPRWKSWRN